jgi:glucose-6-phosphate isomerase
VGDWERFQGHWLWSEELGFGLDCSKMGLPDDWESRFSGHIRRALQGMARIEAGERVNFSENRAVGHYWLRAPELAPSGEIRRQILEMQEQVREFSRKTLSDGHFTHLLSIGIGGSALGPQLLHAALGKEGTGLQPHFMDNTDPDGFRRILGAIGEENFAKTLLVVTSKSGSTAEPRNAMEFVEAVFRGRGLNFASQAVAITCGGSQLDRLARDEGWLARFPMWDWVGGRTSISSAVGLLPAALCAIDVDEFLQGAAQMDRWTRQPAANPAMSLAIACYAAGGGKGRRAMVVLPYRDALGLLGRYLQQLAMESLGKRLDRSGRTVNQGLTVYGNKGSTDQHAYVQQLRDGMDNFFVNFIEVLRSCEKSREGQRAARYLEGFFLGTRAALCEEGRPNLTITLREISPRSLGMLIALYERAVGFYGEFIDVNAYDQPGVEAGKRAADRLLKLCEEIENQLAEHHLSPNEADAKKIAATLDRGGDEEMVFKWLEFLRAGE